MTTQKRSEQTAVSATPAHRPNGALVALQIEAIQVVMRRMRAARSATLDPITNEKLGKIARQQP
ncbi:MAG: hypothetical protein IPM39_06115 [Chloroflexi bacterium]|nr:hypothetical protein [Chloroflexota bacterium]